MAYDEGLAQRLRETLASTDGLTEKKMFGGLCFLVHGNMACGIVDEELRTEYLTSLERSAQSHRYSDWLRPIGISPETALKAPDDGYLMLGDNSPLSYDGREWGWVPAANLRGEVLWVVFPFGRMRVVR